MDENARRMSCQRCGQEFGCSREDIDRCWCAAEPDRLPMQLPPEAGGFNGCLCPSCLRAVAELLHESGSAGSKNDI